MRGEIVTSHCHNRKIYQSQQTKAPQIWQKKSKKTNQKLSCSRYDFPLHDDYFLSIIWEFKWLSLSRKIVEIQKCCIHVNVTSHFYSPFHDTGIVILQIQQQIALLVEVNNVQCFWIISKNFNHQINQRCLMRNIKWMNDAACQKDRPIGC